VVFGISGSANHRKAAFGADIHAHPILRHAFEETDPRVETRADDACERLLKNGVKYRFVIDMAPLDKAGT
jgi:hypothetical protein